MGAMHRVLKDFFLVGGAGPQWNRRLADPQRERTVPRAIRSPRVPAAAKASWLLPRPLEGSGAGVKGATVRTVRARIPRTKWDRSPCMLAQYDKTGRRVLQWPEQRVCVSTRGEKDECSPDGLPICLWTTQGAWRSY